MKKTLLLLVVLAMTFALKAQVGRLDSTFGDHGIRFFSYDPNVTYGVLKVLPAPGNTQYVIYASSLYGFNAITIAKYGSDGNLETSYGTAGYSSILPMRFTDAMLQNDGKIVVAGSTQGSFYGDIHDDQLVARFATDGALDASFNNTGMFLKTYTGFSYEFTQSLTISNNQIAVQGYSASLVGGFAFFHVDVFDMNGANTGTIFLGNLIDNLQLFYPNYYSYSVAFQGDKVVVACTVPDFTGSGNHFSLERYHADGSPDVSFGTEGSTTLGNSFFNGPSIVASQNDKIVVSSYSLDPISGNYGFAVGRFNNNGAFDISFNGSGMQTLDFGEPTPVTPRYIICRGDTLYIGGDKFNAITQKIDFALARFRNDGSPDFNFNGNGKQLTGNSNYSFSLDKMAVFGNRLAVSGRAVSVTQERSVLTALYMLEDSSILLTCPADTMVNTATGICSAIVNGITAKINGVDNSTNISYTISGATTGDGTGTVSGKSFNKGISVVTYSAISNPLITDSFRVTVIDNEAPVISNLTVSPASLWPANHKMTDVEVRYLVTDNCNQNTTEIFISSNEPQANTDKDDQAHDWIIKDAHHIQLRAERSSKGDGRIYTILVVTKDAAGNTDSATVTVVVPRKNCATPDCDDDDDDDNDKLKVNVFPNPSRNYFMLQTASESSKKIILKVYNQDGKLVETRSAITANGIFQLGQYYRKGTYLAELVQGNQRIVVKLVKL